MMHRAAMWSAIVLSMVCACAVPIVPQRSRPGGSARWAEALAARAAVEWSADAVLCRIQGAGVATDGWLPDRGGYWQFIYRSATQPLLYEVSVDSEGGVQKRVAAATPARACHLAHDWIDSPRVWAATNAHQDAVLIHTFDAEFAADAEPERYPDKPVWRIRFWREDRSYETHIVSAHGEWLASY
jgi:hypothetical protein